jgi:hypothetical protein
MGLLDSVEQGEIDIILGTAILIIGGLAFLTLAKNPKLIPDIIKNLPEDIDEFADIITWLPKNGIAIDSEIFKALKDVFNSSSNFGDIWGNASPQLASWENIFGSTYYDNGILRMELLILNSNTLSKIYNTDSLTYFKSNNVSQADRNIFGRYINSKTYMISPFKIRRYLESTPFAKYVAGPITNNSALGFKEFIWNSYDEFANQLNTFYILSPSKQKDCVNFYNRQVIHLLNIKNKLSIEFYINLDRIMEYNNFISDNKLNSFFFGNLLTINPLSIPLTPADVTPYIPLNDLPNLVKSSYNPTWAEVLGENRYNSGPARKVDIDYFANQLANKYKMSPNSYFLSNQMTGLERNMFGNYNTIDNINYYTISPFKVRQNFEKARFAEGITVDVVWFGNLRTPAEFKKYIWGDYDEWGVNYYNWLPLSKSKQQEGLKFYDKDVKLYESLNIHKSQGYFVVGDRVTEYWKLLSVYTTVYNPRITYNLLPLNPPKIPLIPIIPIEPEIPALTLIPADTPLLPLLPIESPLLPLTIPLSYDIFPLVPAPLIPSNYSPTWEEILGGTRYNVGPARLRQIETLAKKLEFHYKVSPNEYFLNVHKNFTDNFVIYENNGYQTVFTISPLKIRQLLDIAPFADEIPNLLGSTHTAKQVRSYIWTDYDEFPKILKKWNSNNSLKSNGTIFSEEYRWTKADKPKYTKLYYDDIKLLESLSLHKSDGYFIVNDRVTQYNKYIDFYKVSDLLPKSMTIRQVNETYQQQQINQLDENLNKADILNNLIIDDYIYFDNRQEINPVIPSEIPVELPINFKPIINY